MDGTNAAQLRQMVGHLDTCVPAGIDVPPDGRESIFPVIEIFIMWRLDESGRGYGLADPYYSFSVGGKLGFESLTS